MSDSCIITTNKDHVTIACDSLIINGEIIIYKYKDKIEVLYLEQKITNDFQFSYQLPIGNYKIVLMKENSKQTKTKNKKSIIMKQISILSLLILMNLGLFAQNVAINNDGSAPNSHAILDVDVSTNDKGILIPRLSTAERTAMVIAASEEGLTVYDETTNSFWLWDGASWHEFLIDNSTVWSTSGNVTDPSTDFLGTTDNNPLIVKLNNIEKFRFQPNGTLEFKNTGNSIFLGQNAGKNDDLSDNKNVFIGIEAGKRNTSGQLNVATGYQALYSNITGSNNVANGYKSLYNNTAKSNTASGYESMYNNTTGYNNVGIGYSSLYSNLSGISNTAVGYQSLYSNQSGHNNVAFGYNSMYSNDGDFNGAFGAYAMYSANDADNTVAVGYESLYELTTGDYNTAVGYRAGYYITDGDNNVAIGRNSGPANGSGSLINTIGIGYNAIPTASNTVHIGDANMTWIGGQVNWSTYSDERFKENVKENVVGLDFINRLNPVTYTWDIDKLNAFRGINIQEIDSAEQASKAIKEAIVYSGFLAQQVEKAAIESNFNFSGVHAPDNKNTAYSLSYAEFVVPLVKAVQELSAENNLQIIELEEIEKQNRQQQKRITELQQQIDLLNN